MQQARRAEQHQRGAAASSVSKTFEDRFDQVRRGTNALASASGAAVVASSTTPTASGTASGVTKTTFTPIQIPITSSLGTRAPKRPNEEDGEFSRESNSKKPHTGGPAQEENSVTVSTRLGNRVSRRDKEWELSRRLHLSGLAFWWEGRDVVDYFECTHGKRVYNVDGSTNKNKGTPFGFVTFHSEKDAAAVVKMSQEGLLQDRGYKVGFSREMKGDHNKEEEVRSTKQEEHDVEEMVSGHS